ncbi:MAG: oligosaccharide flippase family protein [Cytophagales bacterium]|nr:oligosaccharide flippase family protein [Cytophagales bacterium]
MNRLQTVALNSFSNTSILLLTSIFSLISLPLFVRSFGDELYGIYILGLGFSGSLLFLDLGVGRGLTKYIAAYSADRDKKKLSSALFVSFITILFMATLMACLIFLLSFFLKPLFNVSDANIHIAKSVFYFTAVYTFIFWLSRIPNSILRGYQLFYKSNINQLFALALYLIIYLLVFFHKINFELFVVLMLLARLIPMGLDIKVIIQNQLLKDIPPILSLQAIKFYCKVRVNPITTLKNFFLNNDFLKYSTDLFILSVLTFLSMQADRFILGTIMSASYITIYLVITKPLYFIRSINSFIFYGIGPVIAREYSLKNHKIINDILIKGNLLHFAVIIPVTVWAIIFIEPFIDLWMGGIYNDHVIWGKIALMILVLNPFYRTISIVLTNTEHIYHVKRIKAWSSAINFTISITATFYLGIGGVILGSLVQAALHTFLFMRVSNKVLNVSPRQLYSKKAWKIFLYVFCISTIIYYFWDKIIIKSWLDLLIFGGLSFIFLSAYSLYILNKQNILSLRLFKGISLAFKL